MRTDLRNKYLSRPRYSRYLSATGNNKGKAKKLYNANIRLSQAFHPILTQFEVVLRNALNDILIRHFSDPDWIINQKTGFMGDHSLAREGYYLRNCIQKTERKLTRARLPLTSGKIISDQMLNFWISFYTPAHYRLISGQPIHVFTNKPSSENRASIHDKLEDIRKFRNRVNHCEPICFNSHHIDCTYVLDLRTKLFNLIEWIEPDLVPFFRKMDNTNSKINQILSL